MADDRRPVALVTGAHGGMGRACARLLGSDYRLVLSDISEADLAKTAEELTDEGHAIAACCPGDISDGAFACSLVEAARSSGRLEAIFHAAGLSPALADWKAILTVNLCGTEHLLRAIEETADDDHMSVILVASMAGHMAVDDMAIEMLFADPLAPDLVEKAEPLLAAIARPDDPYGLASPAYGHSKRANIATAERRAAAWAAEGRRINSISPGLIKTPMGLAEVNNNAAAKAAFDATPVGRWGSVVEVAQLATFLLSERAGFITGEDVRIDGGLTPMARSSRRESDE